jgi:hypothetical protein
MKKTEARNFRDTAPLKVHYVKERVRNSIKVSKFVCLCGNRNVVDDILLHLSFHLTLLELQFAIQRI